MGAGVGDAGNGSVRRRRVDTERRASKATSKWATDDRSSTSHDRHVAGCSMPSEDARPISYVVRTAVITRLPINARATS